MPLDARHAAETVARVSYGKLVALLAARTHDIAAAEDALAEAFRVALETWPRTGVPDTPEAWLLTVARRMHGRAARHGEVRRKAAPTVFVLQEEAGLRERSLIPDERLKLLFVCAHPAIDPAARTPLMLQTVLGLDAERIAAAFVVAPSAMAQRLVRAKAKIRDAGIPFEEPEPADLQERLSAVLSAVYAAYGSGWEEGSGPAGLAAEAIFLGRLIVGLMPGEPEARGLLALMLYCEARAAARRAGGVFVPLDRQDPRLWSRDLIAEAEAELTVAARQRVFGRFQTEAAIQSVHCQRGVTGRTNTAALVALYDLLAAREPTVGVLVSRAAVHAEAFGPAAGLALLDALEAAKAERYQPFWAVRAHLLMRLGRPEESSVARASAVALTADPALREWLAGQG